MMVDLSLVFVVVLSLSVCLLIIILSMKSISYDHSIRDIGYFWSRVAFMFDGSPYMELFVFQITVGCNVVFDIFDKRSERQKFVEYLSEALISGECFESNTKTIADDCVARCNVPDSSFVADYLNLRSYVSETTKGNK